MSTVLKPGYESHRLCVRQPNDVWDSKLFAQNTFPFHQNPTWLSLGRLLNTSLKIEVWNSLVCLTNHSGTYVYHLFQDSRTLLFTHSVYVCVPYGYPRNRPWGSIGLWDVKVPTLSRQSAQVVVRLLAIHPTLLPRNIIIFMFLALISE
jgi:hypothetical protein